jgi:sulfatase modifying factor 1
MKTGIGCWLVFLSFSVWAQPRLDKKFLNRTNLVPIESPNTYMSKYEVGNFTYRELMYYAASKDSSIYFQMLPDTLIWRTPNSFNEKFVDYYFHHPAYRYYPVVGITYHQAQLFCDMLTDVFNSKILVDNSQIEQVRFRLPTENEWEAAARAGHPTANYPWSEESLRDQKTGRSRANFFRYNGDYMGVAGKLNDGSEIMAPLESYEPNDYGLFNMAGNVAEMVAEKGISKGGSWIHSGANLVIDSSIYYDSHQSWLGFRYVMEIVKFREKSIKLPELNAKDIENTLVFQDSITIPSHYLVSSIPVAPFYVSNQETPNAWFKTFLEDIKKSDQNLYYACLPADSLWLREGSVLNYNYYSIQNHYNRYPVVNITKEAASSFCSWLTEKYNEDSKRKYKKVVFELPTDVQMKAILMKLTDQYHQFIPYYIKGKPTYKVNIHPYDERYFWAQDRKDGNRERSYSYPDNDSTISRGLDGYDLLAPIDEFPKDELGIYHLIGNAAEMVINKEYSVGGCWATCLENSYDLIEESIGLPSPKVGFRMVMRILEE